MAWDRQSLATLIQRNQADVESEIDGVDAKVRRKNLNIIAKLVSLCAHTLYGFIAYCVQQIFPSTSDTENLDRHASFWLSVPRNPATYATGFVVFSGVAGRTIEEGTRLIRADGIEYEVTASGVFSAATLTLAIEAAVAGQSGNADAGTTLLLSQPLDSVSSNAVVASGGISGGADAESNESVNDRISSRVKNPPHGGADEDYKTWAREVPGVTRAWVYPKELGAGTVTVRFVRDDDANIIPDSTEVAAVQAYIDSKAPVTAVVTVVAPVAAPLDFNIQLTPDTLAVRTAVIAELTDLITRESIPAGTLLISHIREAISLAAGETNHVLISPTSDVTRSTGLMTIMGNVTWS